jgi:hypothetical protein
MMMSKKNIVIKVVIGIFILTVIGIGVSIYSLFSTTGFDIQIVNNLDQPVSGLYITYQNITSDVPIPEIMAHSKYELNIDPSEEFGENSMLLYYFDKDGNKQEERLVGYFEKGYWGTVKVWIQSIDEDGKMELKIEENLF